MATEEQRGERRVWTRQEIVLTPMPFTDEFVPLSVLSELAEEFEKWADEETFSGNYAMGCRDAFRQAASEVRSLIEGES